MPMELAALDYTSVIELTSDSVLKAKFAKVPIAPFWSSVIEEYESFFKKKQHKHYYRLRRRSCANQVFLDIRKQKASIAPHWTLHQI